MSLFVHVVTHYGSNESNDSFGFFCVRIHAIVELSTNNKMVSKVHAGISSTSIYFH